MTREPLTRAALITAALLTTACTYDRPGKGPLNTGELAKPAASAVGDDAELYHQAAAILRKYPLIDGHNDVPYQYNRRHHNHICEMHFGDDLAHLDPPMHTDIPRLYDGGVGGQFWSVYIPSTDVTGVTPGDAKRVNEQIDVVYRLIEQYPDHMELALTANDVERIFRSGKVASLIGMEGGHSIENSLAVLRMTYELGCRYMTLTHMDNATWADSATDEPQFGGLSPFGEQVVLEMNRLGMMVDLSHVSFDTMRDALRITRSPVIFSHSSAYEVCRSPRNVPDDVLAQTAANGGIVMVTYVPAYVNETLRIWYDERQVEIDRLAEVYPDDEQAREDTLRAWGTQNPKPQPIATISQVVDHIDHIREVAGIDHVGIGGDYDGIRELPEGLEDVSTYPSLLVELLRRGYTEREIRKIIGGNILRVMRVNERMAEELRAAEEPRSVRIEEIDPPLATE